MGLNDQQKRHERYDEYSDSLRTLRNIQETLAQEVNLASKQFKIEIAKIDNNIPNWERIATEADRLAEGTLARGSEVLASLNVTAMLPRKRRPTAPDQLEDLIAASAQIAMRDRLAELENAVECVRVGRLREEEIAKRRHETQRRRWAGGRQPRERSMKLLLSSATGLIIIIIVLILVLV